MLSISSAPEHGTCFPHPRCTCHHRPMSVGKWIDLLVPLVAWLALVYIPPGLRNRRLLLVLGLGTVLYYGSAFLPHTAFLIARVGLAIGFLVVVFWPERVGLIKPSMSDAHKLLDQARSWLRGEVPDTAIGLELEAALARDSFPVADGCWALASTLYRRAIRLRLDGSLLSDRYVSSSMTAALDYWWAAVKPDLITRHPDPDAWDFGTALRCLFAEYTDLIPGQAYEEDPIVPVGGWDDSAEDVVRALREIPSPSSEADHLRDALGAALTRDLAVARGSRTADALEEASVSVRRFNELAKGFRVAEDAAFAVRRSRRRTLAQRIHLRSLPAAVMANSSVGQAPLDELAEAALAHEDAIPDDGPAPDVDRADGAADR